MADLTEDLENEARTESLSAIPKSDFMTDVRSNFFSTPVYFSFLDSLTGGKALSFSRIALSGLSLVLAFAVPWYLSTRSVIEKKSYLLLPNILIVIVFVYIAYLILKPMKQKSTLEVGVQYFLSNFFYYPFSKNRFSVDRIEGNLVYFTDHTIGMCYEVEGVFNQTMFEKDVLEARRKLTTIRSRLMETTIISMLEISKTEFQPQRRYLNKVQENAKTNYQRTLAKRTRLHYDRELGSEQILKTTVMYRVHNKKELEEVKKSLGLLLNNNFKRVVTLSEEETRKFLEGV